MKRLSPSPLGLLKVLWALMMLFLPWVMLEVRPRVIWMDVLFVFWAASALWGWHRCRPLPGLPKPVFEYGLLLLFWISAILLSGLFVSHREAYLFEATGLIYLAILSWPSAYVTGTWLDYRWAQSVLCKRGFSTAGFRRGLPFGQSRLVWRRRFKWLLLNT